MNPIYTSGFQTVVCVPL